MWRRGPAIGVAWLAATAAAAPAVGPVVVVSGAPVTAEIESAFAEGVRDGAPAPRPQPPPAEALEALDAGERAYLEGRLPAAERALAKAADALVAGPTDDAAPAARAALLLAQVLSARGRRADADRVLERALRALPGFPAGVDAPPPAVGMRIEALRSRLGAELRGRLVIRSEPPGAEVRLDGVPQGRTPLELQGLPARPLQVRVEGAGRVATREVTPADPPPHVRFDLDASTPRAALAASLGRAAAEDSWAAVAALQAVDEADAVCVALADDEQVLVARLDAADRTVRARRGPRPTDAGPWRALGRYCSPSVPGDVPPAEAEAALWPDGAEGPQRPSRRRTWAYGALGGGAALAGVGLVFGARALGSESDFDEADTAEVARSAREDARRQALVTDVTLGLSAALIAVGFYLLFDDADDGTVRAP